MPPARSVSPTQRPASAIPRRARARLAAETIQQLAAIDGVAGVHLLVAGNEQAVPGILDGAGVRVDRDGR